MRITVLAIGTTGDVRPAMAFGAGLVRSGHRVKLATHATYEPLVRSLGMDFSLMAGDPRTDLSAALAKVTNEQHGAFARLLSGVRYARRTFGDQQAIIRQLLVDAGEACRGADVVVCSPLIFVGRVIAEQLGIPVVFWFFAPVTPTTAFPAVNFSRLPHLGPRYNRLTYALGARMLWTVGRPMLNWCRAELGMAPMTFLELRKQLLSPAYPWLYGFSPTIVPRPPDWGPHIHVTGAWFLDRLPDWQPPADLQRFLDASPPPVYVGFGSMPTGDPISTAHLIAQALRQSGRRGIVASGWGNLVAAHLPDNVFLVDAVPHDWLFPRVSVVVHHGGSGTTAAGLRAGVPNVVVPFYADQPFWGQRVHALGAGPRPIPWRHLTAERLARAIVEADRPDTRTRAAALGARIRAEDGVAGAVAALEHEMGVRRVARGRIASPTFPVAAGSVAQ